ncbi:MAG: hypothetical protein NWE93_02975 [Candidatus Bathyarchaeota archaeon]|nr:hypothetical protein [Candidatus Bathyarchaeota archaeon]
MGYQISYPAGEEMDCSSQIVIADRIFYVKLFEKTASRFFSGDQEGIIQKEISKNEFDLWVDALADNQAEAAEIQRQLRLGKKY